MSASCPTKFDLVPPFFPLNTPKFLCFNKAMPQKPTNGFATKSDLKQLEKKMDKRFTAVDDRFKWFRLEIKDDLELWKQDAFREFEHRWQQLADPVLKELVAMREEQTLHHAQHVEIENRLEKIELKVNRIDSIETRIDSIESLLVKIAKKVGVTP